jgi:hypothetical protein
MILKRQLKSEKNGLTYWGIKLFIQGLTGERYWMDIIMKVRLGKYGIKEHN